MVRTTGDTGTSTVGYNAYRLRVSGTGRFHLLPPERGEPSGEPSLLWDSQPGRVGTVPGVSTSVVAEGHGAGVVPLTHGGGQKTVPILDAIA